MYKSGIQQLHTHTYTDCSSYICKVLRVYLVYIFAEVLNYLFPYKFATIQTKGNV